MMKDDRSEWNAWKRRWGASAVAGVVSVAIHGVLLAGLCFLELSRSSAAAAPGPSPEGTIQRIGRLAGQIRVVAKPKTQRPAITAGPGAEPAVVEGRLETVRAIRAVDVNLPVTATAQPFLWSGRDRIAESVTFFGSEAARRRVCYVIDASGSMQGMFDQVRRELTASIEALAPDQFFALVVFGSGGLRTFGGAPMVRATPGTKQAAAAFLEAIEPSGSADAIAALERAKDIGAADKDLLIYFLTDGFETAGADAAVAVYRMNNLLDAFAPGVQVNTIGFWPRSEDRRRLEKIAEATGGVFTSLGRAADGRSDTTDLEGHSFLEGMGNDDE